MAGNKDMMLGSTQVLEALPAAGAGRPRRGPVRENANEREEENEREKEKDRERERERERERDALRDAQT